jgi:hypothetical protein
MTMNKKLIVYWNGIVKIDNEHNIIRDDGMLQRILDTIAALEAADKEIARVQSLHEGLMKNADKMNDELRAEIAALKAAKIADLDSAAESLWKK